MNITDATAVLAVAMSGGALALEVRRWQESGPRLHLQIMGDASTFPVDDGERKLLLTVTNRGSAPTQITHFVVFAWSNPIKRILGKQGYVNGFVKGSPVSGLTHLPSRLDVGDRWMGIMIHASDTDAARAKGHLYVGVCASHSSRYFLKKVPRAPKIPEKEIETRERVY